MEVCGSYITTIPAVFTCKEAVLSNDPRFPSHPLTLGALALVLSTSKHEMQEEGWALVVCEGNVGWLHRWEMGMVINEKE